MDLNKLFEEVLEDERLFLTKKGEKALEGESLHFIPFDKLHKGMKAYHPSKMFYVGKIVDTISSLEELDELAEPGNFYSLFNDAVKARIAEGKKVYKQFVVVKERGYGLTICPYFADPYCLDDGWASVACYVKY